MSVLDSLLVGVFGMLVVFIVLVGLSLLLKLQTALVSSLTKKKQVTEPPAAAESTAPDIQAPQPPAQCGEPVHTPAPRTAPDTSPGGGVKKKLRLMLNNKAYEVEIEEEAETAARVPAGKPVQAPAAAKPSAPAGQTAPEPIQSAPAAGETITAPVPGTVLDIRTTVGAKVRSGDLLVLLEAMKMENEIVAVKDGTVVQILTSKGAAVGMGTPLIVLQ
jgi:biotin carboxyl carrier protein/Na+-transporting methylmalonyl-CoA/oxaloacetate decarboxylase gamma subunit